MDDDVILEMLQKVHDRLGEQAATLAVIEASLTSLASRLEAANDKISALNRGQDMHTAAMHQLQVAMGHWADETMRIRTKLEQLVETEVNDHGRRIRLLENAERREQAQS